MNIAQRRSRVLEHKLYHYLKRKNRKKRSRVTKPVNPNPNRIINTHRVYRRYALKNSRKGKGKKGFKKVVFPPDFSFINNTDNVLLSLERAKKFFRKGYQVEFDLSNVNELTPETIALYIACIKDKNFSRGLGVRGNNPQKPHLEKLLLESGFFKYVHPLVKVPQTYPHILLNKITKFKVENDTAKDVCINAVKNTFNNASKFRPIYEILIECMANTKNHADGEGKEGKFNWWLFEYNDPKTKISSFTFLDLGIGIFNSLPVKNFVKTIRMTLGFSSNVNLVPKLLNGEITSKTGLKERGLGLPLIYQHSQNKYIRNFRIISNDVHANLETGIYRQLNHNFDGTFLYWELHPTPKN